MSYEDDGEDHDNDNDSTLVCHYNELLVKQIDVIRCAAIES